MNKLLYSLRNVYKTRSRESGYTLRIPELDISHGERIGLVGASGCGKSTTLDLLGLALMPDAGADSSFRFLAGDRMVSILDMWRKKQHAELAALRLCHLNYIIQTGGLLPFLTVAENMALTAQARGTPDPKKQVNMLAERLGIAHLLCEKPSVLSVGERQRVAIGRALAGNPRVILADEPTAALDPVNAREVMRLLLGAMDAIPDVTFILVSHEAALFNLAPFRLLHMETAKDESGGISSLIMPGNFVSTPMTTNRLEQNGENISGTIWDNNSEDSPEGIQ